MSNSELASIVFKMVLIFLSTWVSLYVIPFLSELTEKYKYSRTEEFVNAAVKTAEQVIKGSGKGAAKKEKVLAAVSDWLKKYSIDMTEEELDALIESTVFTMNRSEGIAK